MAPKSEPNSKAKPPKVNAVTRSPYDTAEKVIKEPATKKSSELEAMIDIADRNNEAMINHLARLRLISEKLKSFPSRPLDSTGSQKQEDDDAIGFLPYLAGMGRRHSNLNDTFGDILNQLEELI